MPSSETTTREFVQAVFHEVGKPVRLQVAPEILLRALGLFNPALRETIEMFYEFKEQFIVDHSRFARKGSGITQRSGRPSGGRRGGMAMSDRRQDEGQGPEILC